MTSWHFVVVANAIAIVVGFTVTAADAEGVELVSVTVAVFFRYVRASALVDGTRSVADATLVIGAKAVVYIVTYSISVGIVVDDGSRSIRFTRT